MANRITMSICGDEYTLVADETAAYMQKVGSTVDEKMRELMETAHVSRNDAAVLAAVNLADELYKAQESTENLRRQLKSYLDEAAQADRVIVMNGGECAMEGAPREVFSKGAALREYGLEAPEMTALSHLLRGAGIPVAADVMTVEEMEVELCRLK